MSQSARSSLSNNGYFEGNNVHVDMNVPLPPPSGIDLWNKNNNNNNTNGSRQQQDRHNVAVVVRSPWNWVLEEIKTENMTILSTPKELPSSALSITPSPSVGELTPATPLNRRRRARSRVARGLLPATLRLEVVNANTGMIEFAAHGTSAAFDGLEDKDELVRTIQRCRCEELNLTPPSILLNWDVTLDECLNVVGQDLPVLPGIKKNTTKDEDDNDKVLAVLKEPMGSQGQGIYFVSTAKEIHQIVDLHRDRALKDPDLLDNLISVKGRIPSWVLQAEVTPSLLIRGGRKFHIRTYIAVVEKLNHEDLIDIYVYNRHEVRVAGVPVSEGTSPRDKRAHITNGALSNTTERLLLHEVEELIALNLQQRIEIFVAKMFASHLLQDIARRVSTNINNFSTEETNLACLRKFAIAGLDLMVTANSDHRIYLLEANVNPAAPPEDMITDDFKQHLCNFLKDLMDLVVGVPSPNFLSADDILEANGILD